MTQNLSTRLKQLAVVLFGAGCLATVCCAQSAEVNWPDRQVSLQAQEQPLADFLRDLLRAAGMRALPSDAVAGRISGRFTDRPEKIFNDVVRAYDLLPYFDGAVMYVAAGEEIQSRTIRVALTDVEPVARVLKATNVAAPYQSLELVRSEGLVKVRGAPQFVSEVEQLVVRHRRRPPAPTRAAPARAAVSSPALIVRSFPLKYASAADQSFFQSGQEMRIPGVVTLLRSMTGIGSPLIPTVLYGESRQGGSLSSVRGRGLRRFERKDGRDGPYDPDYADREPSSTQGFLPAAGAASAARIEADPNLNTVLVRDYEGSMPVYEDLIAQLDREPQLVEIKVTIIDVDRSKLKDIGVDWQYQSGSTSVAAGGGDIGVQNGGLLLNTVLGDAGHFLARVNALARSGSANVISRPQVLTLSNLEAVLATDRSFFVRVAGNEDVDLFDVSVGTSLRVVPTVAGDANDPQIRLRVGIEDGSLSDDARVDDIPIVERSTLNTQAVIYDGQSLLLGGLTRDESTRNTTKVPLLGDVPGVGKLFRRTTSATSSQERLFLISPRIVTRSATPVATPRQPPGAPPASITTAGAASGAVRRDSQSASQPAQAYLDGF